MFWDNLLDLIGTGATAALMVGLALGAYVFYGTPLLRRLFVWLLGVWLLNAGLDILGQVQTVVPTTLYASGQRTLARCAHMAVVWLFLWQLFHIPRGEKPGTPLVPRP